MTCRNDDESRMRHRADLPRREAGPGTCNSLARKRKFALRRDWKIEQPHSIGDDRVPVIIQARVVRWSRSTRPDRLSAWPGVWWCPRRRRRLSFVVRPAEPKRYTFICVNLRRDHRRRRRLSHSRAAQKGPEDGDLKVCLFHDSSLALEFQLDFSFD